MEPRNLQISRGIPTPLNTTNSVRWLPPEAFNANPTAARFKGDSFTAGTGDDPYMLNSLSVFVAPGFKSVNGANNNPADLADWFQSTFLRIDQNQDGNLSADETVSVGTFNAATNSIDNTSISYTKTGQQYISANGAAADIWKVTYGKA